MQAGFVKARRASTLDGGHDTVRAKFAVTIPNPVMIPPSCVRALSPVVSDCFQIVGLECFVVSPVRDALALWNLPPALFCFGLSPMMLADKRPPSSPVHEREVEPFFWSRSKSSERIYKKTHAAKLGNHNHTNDGAAAVRIPAVLQRAPRLFGYQRVEESLGISESKSQKRCSDPTKLFILADEPEMPAVQRFLGPVRPIACKSLLCRKNP